MFLPTREIGHSITIGRMELPTSGRKTKEGRAFHGKCEGMEPLFSEKRKKSFSDFQECLKNIPEFFMSVFAKR